jgi:hypothetical protein
MDIGMGWLDFLRGFLSTVGHRGGTGLAGELGGEPVLPPRELVLQEGLQALSDKEDNVTEFPVRRVYARMVPTREMYSMPVPTDEMVWAICPHLRNGQEDMRCMHCPRHEEVRGEQCTRGCYLLAQETCRIVFTMLNREKFATVAQLVERGAHNTLVVGSSPAGSTKPRSSPEANKIVEGLKEAVKLSVAQQAQTSPKINNVVPFKKDD